MRYVVRQTFLLAPGRPTRVGEELELAPEGARFFLGCGYIEPKVTEPEKKVANLKALQQQQALAELAERAQTARTEATEALAAAEQATGGRDAAALELKELREAAAELLAAAKKKDADDQTRADAEQAKRDIGEAQEKLKQLAAAAKEAVQLAETKEKAASQAEAAAKKAGA